MLSSLFFSLRLLLLLHRFNLVHSVAIELNELTEYQEIQARRSKVDDYATNNVGIIALLELCDELDSDPTSTLKPNNSSSPGDNSTVRTPGRKYIWVANFHAYWNPQYPEVKLLQVRTYALLFFFISRLIHSLRFGK